MQNRTLKERALDVVLGAGVVLFVVGGALLFVYVVTGTAEVNTLRWWAAIASLAVPLVGFAAWKLAALAAREHLAGFDRGMDKTEAVMTHAGRGLAVARAAARAAVVGPSNDDALLPKVGAMKYIDAPHGRGEIVE